ncbi:MAG TPA: pilus assembly protein PilM [Candidatus Methylomirabilis sp.]|nr:pilus assembly protein PilM [Candidatus Methylomirabilis sp.]
MAWGLEIDSDVLRLCRAEMRRGQLSLRRRVEVPLPAGLVRPSLKEANVSDVAALAARVRDLRDQAGCAGWVRLALPDPIFMLRTLVTETLPEAREEARKFLRWQARDLLPFPAEEVRLDFLPSGTGADGKLQATCLMARDRILAEYEQALTDAGLRAAVLDARSVSLAQAASAGLGGGIVGLLDITQARTTLLVVQEGKPRLWRILIEDGQAWTGDDRDRLVREMVDTVSFYHESEGIRPLDKLILAGPSPLASEVAALLGEWLEAPISLLDLRTALRVEGHPDDLVHWGAAIGAAIRPC